MSPKEHLQVSEVRGVLRRHMINLGAMVEWQCPSMVGTDLDQKMLIVYLALEGMVKPEDAARLRKLGAT